MAEGKDIAWVPIATGAGALIVGILVGVYLIGPKLEKRKANKEAKKLAGQGSTKK